ncbi:hypothetical protein [Psychrobacter pulmonis]|uniref:hypothetical protein n=1 Tax=Psychrobacter pulmonis TaxID=228654 RepID=UPI002A0A4465|nr:hypothetical protein [Psychrobacter pulmonis]
MLLSFIARHSTLIMPVCAIVGFVFPNLSNAVLVYLPQILFFLMFFTLLGIDQYAVGGQNSWELGGVEMEFLRII